MAITISDMKVGTLFVLDSDPWEVLESNRVMIGRGQGHLETKIRNLRTGNVLRRNFQKSDKFDEAEVELENAEFVYENRGKVVFRDPEDKGKRQEIDHQAIEEKLPYLTEGMQVKLIRFDGDVLGAKLPPKVDLTVTQADPWVKGDTSSGGTKKVTVETGYELQVPPFINRGDVIRINTETGAYAERVEKA